MKDVIKDIFRMRRLLVLKLELGSEEGQMEGFELNLTGDQVQLKARQSLKSIAHFVKVYEKGPVVLCLSGKGLLDKLLPEKPASVEEAFRLALPKADIDSFYLQYTEAAATQLQVIRKSSVDPLLSELESVGFEPVALCLGLEAAKQGNLIRVLLDAEPELAVHAGLAERLEQLRAKAKLKGLSMLLAITVFLLLLCNFLLWQHYSSSASQLLQQQQANGGMVKKYAAMEHELSDQLRIIARLGWTAGYPYAWLTDRVMASKPHEIQLSGFWIHAPLEKGQDSLLNKGQLKLSGYSPDAAQLNNWMQEMKAFDWLKRCDLQSYEVVPENGRGKFSLYIELSDWKEEGDGHI